MTINFNKEKSKRANANDRAEKLIQYVRDNCTQSQVMLDFLDQPSLKEETAKALHEFKAIEDEMNKERE